MTTIATDHTAAPASAPPAPVIVTVPHEIPLPRTRLLKNQTRPGLMIAVLVTVDLVGLSIAMLIAVYGRWAMAGDYDPMDYLQLCPCLVLFAAAFAGAQLYPGVPFSPAEELRRLVKVITLVFLGLGTATFFFRGSMSYSRSVLVISWILSLGLVWTGRGLARMILARMKWWGYGAVILGGGESAENVVRLLQTHPSIGLKPVAVVAPVRYTQSRMRGVPVIPGLHRARGLARQHGIHCAILAMPDLESRQLQPLLQKLSRVFPRLIYLPHLNGFSSLWVTAADMGGMLGLEVRHRLLDPGQQTIKRVMDLTLVIISSPIVLPLVALIALAIKIDSRGPVFFASERFGKGGSRFKAWKFRSMVREPDQVLEKALALDAALRTEWLTTQKLRHDPRITRVGRFLRKTSLDELPQLWNVLCGQMSLVGPRPILDDEPAKYGDVYSLYTKVTPGLTGMWQVSGRSNLPYEERLRLTTYYVRNWSVWLDLYLLGRTVLVVLRGDGAY